MAKYVVLGLEGESDLYVVDIDGGTVSKAKGSGDGSSAGSSSASGQTVRGVSVAVVTDSRDDAASGKLD